jgi:hypothetical protein
MSTDCAWDTCVPNTHSCLGQHLHRRSWRVWGGLEELQHCNAQERSENSTYLAFSLRIAADGYAALCSRFDDDSEASRQALARLRSCACQEVSIFLDRLPVSANPQLSNACFVCGMRHQIGLGQMPRRVPDCLGQPTSPRLDHAMVHKACSKEITMRNDLILGSWRRIAHHTGVATAAEPAVARLRGQAVRPTERRLTSLR